MGVVGGVRPSHSQDICLHKYRARAHNDTVPPPFLLISQSAEYTTGISTATACKMYKFYYLLIIVIIILLLYIKYYMICICQY